MSLGRSLVSCCQNYVFNTTMKGLSEYVCEYINDNITEGKETVVRFRLYDDDASKKLARNIAALANTANIYYEKIDHGFKLAVKPGQNVTGIEAALNDFINGIPEDKAATVAKRTKGIIGSIESMKAAAAVDNGE